MRIFLLLSLIFFSSFSFACTCATPSLAESFEKADYVYIGQIQSSELTSETEVTNFLSIEEEFKGHRDTDILCPKFPIAPVLHHLALATNI